MLYDIVLIEKPGCDGITLAEIKQIFPMLKDAEAFPIELEAKEHECSAMGFITPNAAEQLNYEYDALRTFVANILDDMANETPDNTYSYQNLTIYLTR